MTPVKLEVQLATPMKLAKANLKFRGVEVPKITPTHKSPTSLRYMESETKLKAKNTFALSPPAIKKAV